MSRNEEGNFEVTQIVSDMAGEQLMLVDEFPNLVQPAVAPSLANRASIVPVTTQDYSMPIEFQQPSAFDESLFTFDNLDIINGFDIGDFDMSRTPL